MMRADVKNVLRENAVDYYVEDDYYDDRYNFYYFCRQNSENVKNMTDM